MRISRRRYRELGVVDFVEVVVDKKTNDKGIKQRR